MTLNGSAGPLPTDGSSIYDPWSPRDSNQRNTQSVVSENRLNLLVSSRNLGQFRLTFGHEQGKAAMHKC